MKSTNIKFAIFILVIGTLSACGGQSPDVPISTSQPTEAIAQTAETSTSLPASTDTALPAPTEPALVTEPPIATEPVAQGATVSFANDVLPIIQSRRINCHGGDRTEEGLVMLTYADIMAGSNNGRLSSPEMWNTV